MSIRIYASWHKKKRFIVGPIEDKYTWHRAISPQALPEVPDNAPSIVSSAMMSATIGALVRRLYVLRAAACNCSFYSK
jgi:hypothetical protein